MDFEVGGRNEKPFLRLYERLPDAGLQRRVSGVRLAADEPARGGEVRAGELEREVAFVAAG